MNNKYYILSFLFFFSVSIHSQFLDDYFLNSLPENIKDDVMTEASSKNTKEDYVYRSPNTKQELPYQTLERLIREIEEVKKKYASKEETDNELKRYGHNFFSSIQSSFMPINDPSFSDGYIINPGDSLKLQIIGTNSKILDMKVEREGSINIPNIGKVFISGIELNNAQVLINELVKSKSPGSSAYLTLTGISDIQVLIVGNVINPGIYTISGNTNILHALNASGGIAENGSFRDISVNRNNKLIAKIDLYEIFMNGNISSDYRLRSGDSIVVGPLKTQVAISGAVTNPGIYEINKTSLVSLIDLANGFSQDLDSSESIKISRKNTKSKISVSDNDINTFQVQTGDNVFIPKYKPETEKTSTVKIYGHVVNPGTYSFKEGEQLLSVIKKAGGYKNNAYPTGGSLKRKSVMKLEEKIHSRIYKELISFIVNNIGNTGASSGGDSSLAMLISEFKEITPSGRITVQFDLDKLENNPKLDIEVTDGDEIYIPAINSDIYVFGEVMNPGARMYKDTEDLNDYIKQSGGFTKYAMESKVIIVEPNGDSKSVKVNRFNLLQGINENDLLPGSLIYVPRDIDPVSDLQSTALFSQVFSSLALSLASLNSIN